MPTCPVCQTAWPSDTTVCPADGAPLGGPAPADTGAQDVTAPGALWGAAPVEEGPDPLVGTSLDGRFTIVRRLGAGGMGVVYEATHAKIGRQVALKVLREKYVDRPEVAARLMNEARLASSVHHEHIVDVFDVGETSDGRTFIVMELLEGESLAQRIRREGPLPEATAIELGLQVASALGAAHDKGIVHRDVKPENVLISPRDGRDFAKVLDFGISKAIRAADEKAATAPRLTVTGMVLGTPLYMSPEQARGEDDLDHRVDVYALGVILYECLTGETPFRGTNYLGIISQVLTDHPVTPRELRPEQRISEAMERVVLRAMAKRREERYPTMAELGDDLSRARDGREVQAPAVQKAPREAPPPRRPLALYTAMGGIALLGGAAIWVNVVRSAPPPAPAPAAAAVVLPAPAPVPPPPPSPTVTLRFASTPPGAEVRQGDRILGTTGELEHPTAIALRRTDQDVKLDFVRPGFERASTTVRPSADGELVEIKLQAARRFARPPAPARSLAQHQPAAPAKPSDLPGKNPYGETN